MLGCFHTPHEGPLWPMLYNYFAETWSTRFGTCLLPPCTQVRIHLGTAVERRMRALLHADRAALAASLAALERRHAGNDNLVQGNGGKAIKGKQCMKPLLTCLPAHTTSTKSKLPVCFG